MTRTGPYMPRPRGRAPIVEESAHRALHRRQSAAKAAERYVRLFIYDADKGGHLTEERADLCAGDGPTTGSTRGRRASSGD
jgi:hypothetical protein